MKDLISVLVISYNSERTIIETLESIKVQSYDKVELVIADDGSVDNTRDLSESWCKRNASYFSSVFTDWGTINKGISRNINRGIAYCTGEWIKIIAADDVLLPNCIYDNLSFIRENDYVPKIVFSKYLYYRDGKILDRYYFARHFFTYDRHLQYRCLLSEIGVNAPTCFMNLAYLKSLGGCDERFPLLDDAPLYLKFLRSGEKLYGFEVATVLYRIHSANTSLGSRQRYINTGFWRSRKDFFSQVLSRELLDNKMYLSWWSRFLGLHIEEKIIERGNRRSDFSLFLRFLKLCDLKHLMSLTKSTNKHRNTELINYVYRN